MSRSVTVLFRRDPSRDRHKGAIFFEGYEVLWPNGRPVAVGMDAFCKHGQRLLGLGRHLRGCQERLIQLRCFPLSGREDDLTRIPGSRVRRFFVERRGLQGRIHFLDGTPTDTVFEIGQDEPRVLDWIGLPSMKDGAVQWIDLAAGVVEPSVPTFATMTVSAMQPAGY